MDKNKLDEAIRLHELYLSSKGDEGQRLSLVNQLITSYDFSGKNLQRSNFFRVLFDECRFNDTDFTQVRMLNCSAQCCHFPRANFGEARLDYSDFLCAYFYNCNFENVDAFAVRFQEAKLTDANLKFGRFAQADFSNAFLIGANLEHSGLKRANLHNTEIMNSRLLGAYLPPPTMMLMAYWGEVSPDLCADLMNYDAANHPDPDKFRLWAYKRGSCPYGDCKVGRAAHFGEYRSNYKPDLALKTPFELMVRVITEKCYNSDWHNKDTDGK